MANAAIAHHSATGSPATVAPPAPAAHATSPPIDVTTMIPTSDRTVRLMGPIPPRVRSSPPSRRTGPSSRILQRRAREDTMPTETWMRLPDARRATVLDAAEAEFARNGYSRGSLNVIAREAGVAKGSL